MATKKNGANAQKKNGVKTTSPIDAYNKQADDSKGSGFFWKASTGTNLIRFLPTGGNYVEDIGRTIFFTSGGAHYNMGSDGKTTVNCPRVIEDRPCAICAWVRQLYDANEPTSEAIAKRIRVSRFWISNIVVLGEQPVVKQFRYGKKLFEKVISYINDPDYGDLTDPVHGFNFKLILKVVDGFNNYDDSRPAKDESPLSDIYPDWEKQIVDLTKFRKCESDEVIKRILNETMNVQKVSDEDRALHEISNQHLKSIGSQPDALSGDTTVQPPSANTGESIEDLQKSLGITDDLPSDDDDVPL
jgi:hypothetical protein